MKFEKWVAEARKDIDRAIRKNVHENSMISGSNYQKSKLFPHWKEFKLLKETRKLVWATWALAIVTIILAIFTIIFSAVSYSQAERVLELSEKITNATERTANATEAMSENIVGMAGLNLIWFLIVFVIVLVIFIIIFLKKKPKK